MPDFNKEIIEQFYSRFKSKPLLIESPGRVNLIGDHTDYNEGFVLPATISKRIYLGIAPNTLNKIRAFALDLNEYVEQALENLSQSNKQWFNYIKGIVVELKIKGYHTNGFDIIFGGDIPIGAGLSSSAAIEGALLVGLDQVFGLDLSKREMAQIGQLTEHNHVGVQCGIMDQLVNLHGEAQTALLLDCRTLDYELIPFKYEDIKIVLCNSSVTHNLASSEYNIRRSQCEEGVSHLQKYNPTIMSLRDVSFELLKMHKNEFSETVLKRMEFVLEENKRVIDSTKCLMRNDFVAFGKMMYASHVGLSEKYEVSCKELDMLVDIAQSQKGVFGSRMMGGGFGGCTINLVESNNVDDFCDQITKRYKALTGLDSEIYITQIGSGTKVPTYKSKTN